MRFRFIWVGRTKSEHLEALIDDYLTRLGRFLKYDVIEVRESASREARICLEEEGKRITGAVASDARMVLLDVDGRQWSSPELAREIERWQIGGVREVAFIVGGHFGVSPRVREVAHARWSLSRLTLTHEMARVVLVEQLYRAFTINRGLPYQK